MRVQQASGGVASTSLCADAYVLELAGPGRIAALSWQVDHPVSAAPDWARNLPKAWNDAERLYALAPGLTVFGAGEGARTRRMLERTGFETFELSWASDFDGVRANLVALGRHLHREAEAEAAIASLDRRLAALSARRAERGVRPRVLYLSASGGTAGGGTYINAAIEAAGGINVMAEEGVTGWPPGTPETVLAVEADIVLTSFFADGYTGTSNRAVRHSAYRRVLNAGETAAVPAGDWLCAGPRLIDAAERIADIIGDWSRQVPS